MADENFNPYSPPLASLVPEPADSSGGVWRDGNLLVVRKGCMLPGRCVKCNQPAVERRKRQRLYWHSPWLYLILVFTLNLLIYMIVALIVQRSIIVQTGVCERHRRRRRQVISIAWLMFVGSVIAIGVGGSLMDNRTNLGLPILLVGCGLLAGAPIYGFSASRLLWAKRIDTYFAWLKGACPEYLAELPELPPLSLGPYSAR